MKFTFKIALVLLLFTASILPSQAEEKKKGWTKDMLEYKHDFIVKETGMSQAQRDKFMPLYEAMEKEIYSVYRNAREQAKKVSANNRKVNDDEYITAARAMANVKVKEGEIECKYFEKYAKILNKKQLFLLKQAELKFTRQMMSKGKK